MPLPSDLIIARHGRFSGNVTMTTTGEAALLVSQLPAEDDFVIGLDEVGREQARHLGGHFLRLFPEGFSACMRSDFTRVAETVDVALPDIRQVVVEPALRERSRGDVARMPKTKFKALYPAEAAEKDRSPLDWRPPNGESLRDKATDLRALLSRMGELAPDQPFPVITSGEVVIAARTVPELGNMDDEALKRGLAKGWPALEVDNAQFDHYTRRNPETGELGSTFDYMMSVRAGTEAVIDSGWIRIER